MTVESDRVTADGRLESFLDRLFTRLGKQITPRHSRTEITDKEVLLSVSTGRPVFQQWRRHYLWRRFSRTRESRQPQ